MPYLNWHILHIGILAHYYYHENKNLDLSFWKLWNISFGFFGVQIAYALQSANISRIFATLGAESSQSQLFLDFASVGRYHHTTDHRFGQR